VYRSLLTPLAILIDDLLGFGVGPLVWAPLSELVGRRISFNASYPLFALFNLLGAVAPNVTTVIIARFLAGTFGSAPLVVSGGQIGDMFAKYVWWRIFC
jgi:MFS family permease